MVDTTASEWHSRQRVEQDAPDDVQALEDVMGKNGLNAVLHLAGLENYIYNRPPNNLDKEFSLML